MRYAMCDPINLAVQRVQLLSSLRVRGRATELRRWVDSGFVFEDKFKGLGFGADDYMTKPFHNEELVA